MLEPPHCTVNSGSFHGFHYFEIAVSFHRAVTVQLHRFVIVLYREVLLSHYTVITVQVHRAIIVPFHSCEYPVSQYYKCLITFYYCLVSWLLQSHYLELLQLIMCHFGELLLFHYIERLLSCYRELLPSHYSVITVPYCPIT